MTTWSCCAEAHPPQASEAAPKYTLGQRFQWQIFGTVPEWATAPLKTNINVGGENYPVIVEYHRSSEFPDRIRISFDSSVQVDKGTINNIFHEINLQSDVNNDKLYIGHTPNGSGSVLMFDKSTLEIKGPPKFLMSMPPHLLSKAIIWNINHPQATSATTYSSSIPSSPVVPCNPFTCCIGCDLCNVT